MLTLVTLGLLGLASAAAVQCSKYAGMSGATLRKALKADTYTGLHNTLGYTKARQYMYSYIDNDNGYVECIYTGLRMSCPYGSMNTGCNSDLNCEHLVPQSFFNEGDPMKSDVHHLRPSYNNANSARSNYPFAEIPTSSVYKWYKLKTITTTPPPTSEQGEWSRLKKSTSWQPRDKEIGDVARAVAYFYTMYPTEAGSINKVGGAKLIAEWNDEVEPSEWEKGRNDRAEKYQGNRNPFVDCPELVRPALEDWM